MYGNISNLGLWDHNSPGWRWALALRTPGGGFHTVRGGIDPGDNHARPQHVEFVDVLKDLRPGDFTLPSPGVAGSMNRGFHIARGTINSGDHRFRPCLVGFADIWHDQGIEPYPHRVALALRTLGWGIHTVGGGMDRGDYRFCPWFVEVVHVWQGS